MEGVINRIRKRDERVLGLKCDIYVAIEMCNLYLKCTKKEGFLSHWFLWFDRILEVCIHFSRAGYEILGVDNNQRAVFFGPEGDTSWSMKRL